MKNIKFILIAMMAIIMGACSSSDDNEEKIEISVSNLAGEWYTEDAISSVDMTLEEKGLSAEVITYEKTNNGYSMYDIETGSWYYFNENKNLRTNLTSTRNNNEVTKDIQVVKVEKNTLLLRSETGATSTYLRIINKVTQGENIVVMAARRVGKSKLINFCMESSAIKKHFICISIDILRTSSIQELTFELGKAVFEQAANRSQKMMKMVVNTLKSINGCFGYDPISNTPTFNLALGEIANPLYTLNEYYSS